MKKTTTLAAFVGSGALLLATPVLAAPDLVIQASDSRVVWGSCAENDVLAQGRIVIRNEGTTEANLRSADDFFRSFVAVYVPENIDLIDKDTKRTKIEPGEQRAITFAIGKGKKKAGRNYNGAGISTQAGFSTAANALEKDKALAKTVQGFLKSRGYAVTVDGNWGRGSRTALSNFQSNVGLPGKGAWNAETAEAIGKLIGGLSKPEVQNIKNEKGETQITIYAVVDPYNLIDESNERNNILSFTRYMPCD